MAKSGDVQGYVRAALEAHGAIRRFFNAGIEGGTRPAAEHDEAVFDAVVAAKLKGAFLGLRHVLPVVLRQGGGSTVNTAPTAGLAGSPGPSTHVASKHGVIELTRTAVCPGPTDTRPIWSLEKQAVPGGGGSVRERGPSDRSSEAAAFPRRRGGLPGNPRSRGCAGSPRG